MADAIHVFCATTLNSIEHAVELIWSISCHTDEVVNIHCMVDADEQRCEKIQKMIASMSIERINATVYSSSVLDKHLEDADWLNMSFSKMAYARLFSVNVLDNVDKFIYLDIDTLVLQKNCLRSLLSIELNENLIGACHDLGVMLYDKNELVSVGSQQYFNTGMMLVNAKKLRSTGFAQSVQDVISSKVHLQYADQTILNKIIKDVCFIDPTFNVMSSHLGWPWYDDYAKLYGYRDAVDLVEKCRIVHMAGYGKPYCPQYQTWQLQFASDRKWYEIAYKDNCLSLLKHVLSREDYSQNYRNLVGMR